MQGFKLTATTGVEGVEPPARLKRIMESLASSLPSDTAFELELNGMPHRIGNGRVKFRVAIHNRRGLSALSSLDEKRIGEAYLDGDISIEGAERLERAMAITRVEPEGLDFAEAVAIRDRLLALA